MFFFVKGLVAEYPTTGNAAAPSVDFSRCVLTGMMHCCELMLHILGSGKVHIAISEKLTLIFCLGKVNIFCFRKVRSEDAAAQ